jgi:hypothetical protein
LAKDEIHESGADLAQAYNKTAQAFDNASRGIPTESELQERLNKASLGAMTGEEDTGVSNGESDDDGDVTFSISSRRQGPPGRLRARPRRELQVLQLEL